MYGIFLPSSDPHWAYEDPSGVPDEVTVPIHMPDALARRVEAAAACEGLTPAGWLLDVVARSLQSRPTAA
jgi:hypothetical protein